MLILLNRISSRLNTISLFHYIRMYELNVELKYQRRSIRLKEYDYTMPGGYFITICTQNRDCLFGDFVRTGNQLNCTGCTGDRIIYTGDRPVAPIAAPPAKSPITPAKSEIILNEFGKIVRDEWLKTVDIRKEIVLDEFVVMPNHFHAIVFNTDISRTGNHINSAGGQLNCTGCTGDRPVAPTVAPTGPPSESIGALMAGYKSAVTKRINLLRRTLGYPVWQRNYYEHIIRNDKELNQIRQYIILNPVNWEKDTEFIPL